MKLTPTIRRTMHFAEARKNSELSFRSVIDHLTDAVVVVDETTAVQYLNPAAVAMVGRSLQQLAGRSSLEFLEEHDRPSVQQGLAEMLAGRATEQHMRVRARRGDGVMITVDVTGRIMDRKNGRARFAVILRDVTPEVERTQQMKEDEFRYRTLVESVDDILFLLDRDGRYTGVFGRWIEREGLTEGSFLGKTAREIFGPEEAAAHETAVRGTIEGRSVTYEWSWKGRGGTKIVQTTLSPILDAFDSVTAVVGIGRDITERLHRSDDLNLMTVALEQAPACVVVTDTNGDIQYVNPRFIELTGYQLEEVLGKNPRMLKSGKTPQDVYKDMWDRLTSGQTWSGEFCNKTKSGEFYWESAVISPVRSLSGVTTHFVAVKQDITLQKRAELEAQESHQRFQKAFASSPIAMVLSTLEDGRVLEANEAALALLGFSHPDIDGSSTVDAAIWPSKTSRLRIMKLVQEQGSVRDVVLNVRRHGDGSVELLASFERMDISGEDSVLIHLVDMTEQRRAEISLRERELELRRLIDESPAGIVVVDGQGSVESCNDAFANMVGCPGKDALEGRDLRTFEATEGLIESWLRRTSEQKLIQNEEFVLCRNDGKPVHILANVVGRFDGQGKRSGFQAYCIDESLQKTLERQLIQAQKMESLGTLAGGIAHDFNNVLGIIFAHLSLLPLTVGHSEKFTSAIEAMSKASERGAGLVRQLMTFARLSEPARELVRVSDIVNEIASLLKETFPKVITLECVSEGQSPVINADPTQMHQILLNLCVNARDAMIPNGGVIRIASRAWSGPELVRRLPDATGGDYAEIEVADNGCGMDETVIPRIFEPFFSTKPKGRGTGLGLSTVYGIVKAHHGFIDVESTAGEGTTFHLFLPATPLPGTVVNSAPSKVNVPLGQETILLVDDEETLREAFRAVLESRGFRVLCARDGEEAISVFREHAGDVNVVVTDFGLPRRLGSDVVADIKHIDPDMKTIVLTGFLDADQRNQLRDLKVDAIIMKPTKPDVVALRIRSILDAH